MTGRRPLVLAPGEFEARMPDIAAWFSDRDAGG
jgi:hypothetical protein